MKTINVSQAEGPVLDWMVAKAKGHELMLFDTLWRDNAALKGYPEPDIERHLQWQPQRGRHVIVELRGLQLDQRNLEVLTPTRCAVDIPGYSTDWSQGGPIIERERIELCSYSNDGVDTAFRSMGDERGNYSHEEEYVISVPEVVVWTAWVKYGSYKQDGPTPLIAAMRCFCVSKLGTTVEVPEELS